MQLQRQVATYYKRKMYKGRSIAARAVDFLFLRLFFFAALYLVFVFALRIIWLSVFLAGVLTVSLSLMLQIYKNYRFNRFIQAEMEKLKKECLLENIVLMDNAAYRRMTRKILKNMGCTSVTANTSGFGAMKDGQSVFAKAFYLHPTQKAGVNELLEAYKFARKTGAGQMLALSPSGFTREAEVFAKRYENITLVHAEEFLALAAEAGYAVDDGQAGEAAMNALRQNAVTPGDIRDAALHRGKARAYMLCGIFALVWSYVSGFKIYYPVIAVVCFALAFFIRRRETRQAKSEG